MSHTLRIVTLGLVAISLAACGSSDSPPPAPTVDLAEINSSNAMSIAGAVVKAAYQSGDIGSFVEPLGAVGTTTVTKTVNLYSKIGELQVGQTSTMLKESQIGTFQAPIESVQECTAGGSSVLSGEIANTDTLSPDDVVTLQFFECNDGITVVNGTFSMRILSFTGDFSGGSVTFDVAVTLTDFSVSQDGITQTANGTLTIGLSMPSTGPISMRVESQSFSVSDGSSSNSLQDFDLVQTIDPVTGDYSLTVSGMVGSSLFEGMVEFTTSATLTGTGEDFAFAGEILITGDGGTTIAVFALDAELVRIELDLKGDGIVDQVIDTSWSELLAS